MSKIESYQTITSKSPEDLDRMVNSALEQGRWRLFGKQKLRVIKTQNWNPIHKCYFDDINYLFVQVVVSIA